MSEISVDIRHCIFYQFQLGNNISAATRYVCATLSEDVVADPPYRDWFRRFRKGDTSLEDCPRFGHPLQSDIEQTKVLIEDSPWLTTLE